MAITSHFKIPYFYYLSQPALYRPLYKTIYRGKSQKIMELGIGTGQRALRMIEVAALSRPAAEIQYTGIDLFEARSAGDGPGLSLKSAHCLIKATGARIRLVPGDPLSALARVANTLGPTDLIVISHRQDPESLAGAWFYLPRLLHPGSVVFTEQEDPSGELVLRVITPVEIEELAGGAVGRRVA